MLSRGEDEEKTRVFTALGQEIAEIWEMGKERRESGLMPCKWGPLENLLVSRKTWPCGPRMKSTKKDKTILEISSFQKVYFWHGFEISKIVSRFECEKAILPLFGQNLIFWASNTNGLNTKVAHNHKTNQMKWKSRLTRKQTQSSHACTYTQAFLSEPS